MEKPDCGDFPAARRVALVGWLVSHMNRKILRRGMIFGFLAEGLLLTTTFILYSFHHGREPMEPPLNLTGTVIQMPGIVIANALSQRLSEFDPTFYWMVTLFVQFVVISFVGCLFFVWRKIRSDASRRNRSDST